MKQRPIVIIGGGGHARVLAETARACGLEPAGYLAPTQGCREFARYLGTDDALAHLSPSETMLVLGIGSTKPTQLRQEIYHRARSRGFDFATLVHPSAVVASSASLSAGVQLLAGCVIQNDVVLDEDVIVNTCASIDHDSRAGAHAHVAPGATVCGGVIIGARAHIGAGAVVTQGALIPEDTFVRAGQVVGAGVSNA